MERCSTPPSDALPALGASRTNRERTYPKTKMTKDEETQYERTGQIQQREISGHDLLSRFEEYRKKRKKGTEIPHEGKLDLPQGRVYLANLYSAVR